MILIVAERDDHTLHLNEGDTFNLVHEDSLFRTKETILSTQITKKVDIDYFCIFIFVNDDGSVVSPNFCGMFGQRDNLPYEIRTAQRIDWLTPQQKENYVNSRIMQEIPPQQKEEVYKEEKESLIEKFRNWFME